MVTILDPQWNLFTRVAEHGSISRAADTLNCPASVISRHINQLEKQCGQRLFRRTGRGVVLTEFGQNVYSRIVPLIAQANQIADDIVTAKSIPVGDVHIGLLPSSVPKLAEQLLRAARERFPQVQLHLTEGASSQLEEWLRSGRLDLALLLREDVADVNPGEPILHTIALDLIGPRADPVLSRGAIDFAEMDGLPLILPSEPHVLRKRLSLLAKEHNIHLNIVAEVGTLQLQKEVAASGAGYSVIASTSGFDWMERDSRLSAARIVKPELQRHVVLGATPLRPNTLATRSISRLIVSLFSQLPSDRVLS